MTPEADSRPNEQTADLLEIYLPDLLGAITLNAECNATPMYWHCCPIRVGRLQAERVQTFSAATNILGRDDHG